MNKNPSRPRRSGYSESSNGERQSRQSLRDYTQLQEIKRHLMRFSEMMKNMAKRGLKKMIRIFKKYKNISFLIIE